MTRKKEQTHREERLDRLACAALIGLTHYRVISPATVARDARLIAELTLEQIEQHPKLPKDAAERVIRHS